MGANSTEREGARDERVHACKRTKGAIEPCKELFYALVVELGMEHGALDILHANQPAAPLRATARRGRGAGGGARAGKPLHVAPERRRERPCRPDECHDHGDRDSDTAETGHLSVCLGRDCRVMRSRTTVVRTCVKINFKFEI